MTGAHDYILDLTWTGNLGSGTSAYRAYSRDHEVTAPGKPTLLGTSDPAFRGDPSRWSPEDLLLAALSQCHLLWYLHLAAVAGVIVTAYRDEPTATMVVEPDGAGHFTGAVLHPTVTVSDASMVARAEALHHDANARCFIARSVNFPVGHEPRTLVAESDQQ